MLPPHELGQKTFTKAMRGYEPAEVDEYIDFLIENYTELYKVSDDYDKKLRAIASRLKGIKDDENTIRNAVVNAQKMSDATVAQANEKAKEIIAEATAVAETITSEAQKKSEAILADAGRKYDKKIGDAQAKADVIVSAAQAKSDALLYSAKQRCAKILADYRLELRSTVEALSQTKQAAEKFRTELFDSYKTHIDMIKGMVPAVGVDLSADYETRFTSEILEGIKEDAIMASEQISVPDSSDEEAGEPDLPEEDAAELSQPVPDGNEAEHAEHEVFRMEQTGQEEDDDVVEYVPSLTAAKAEDGVMPGQMKLGEMYIQPGQDEDYSEEYIEEYADEPSAYESEDDIVEESDDDDLEQQAEDYYRSERKKKKGGFLGLFGKNKKDKDDDSPDRSFDSDDDEDKKKLDIFQGFDE